jgi:hypothetical protein
MPARDRPPPTPQAGTPSPSRKLEQSYSRSFFARNPSRKLEGDKATHAGREGGKAAGCSAIHVAHHRVEGGDGGDGVGDEGVGHHDGQGLEVGEAGARVCMR